jgi:hypothetical protein
MQWNDISFFAIVLLHSSMGKPIGWVFLMDRSMDGRKTASQMTRSMADYSKWEKRQKM